MEVMNTDRNIVLAGLRRNQMLVYRPDLETGKFKDLDEGIQFKDMERGSHRQMDSWSTHRNKWLTNGGRPEQIDWSTANEATKDAAAREEDYCRKDLASLTDHSVTIGGKEIPVPVINIDCDEQELFTDTAALEQLHPKIRRNLESFMKMKDHGAAKKDLRKSAQMKAERDRVMKAYNELDNPWKYYVTESLVKISRKDISANIVPKVGKKKGTGKKSKTGAAKKAALKKKLEEVPH